MPTPPTRPPGQSPLPSSPPEAWEPLLRTPLHPEYPCGHCIVAAAFAEITAAEFGPQAKLVFQDPVAPAAGRTFTPAAYSCHVSLARVLAGAHFRFSGETSQAMARKIAVAGWTGYMRPLSGPRPAEPAALPPCR